MRSSGRHAFSLFFFLLCFLGDSKAEDASKPFGAPTELTATLVTPIDVDLSWKDNATNEAGYLVEYSPEGSDEFVIIEAVPENTTTYRHPHLLPHTRFVYRVRPIFGKASNTVEIQTGKESPQQAEPEKPQATNSDGTGASLRSESADNASTPTDLQATLLAPAGVRLDWQDHSSDEDGFLVEIQPEWDSIFKAAAYLEPNTTSTVSYGFPFETKFHFRIRAFFYGQPSNRAECNTGADPDDG